MDDLPVIHLCLFGCGLVVNSAPTRQSGLVLYICDLMQNLTSSHDAAVDDHLADILSKLVFGSNMIENAGTGVDVTSSSARPSSGERRSRMSSISAARTSLKRLFWKPTKF